MRFSAMSGGAGEQGCQGNGYTVCHDKVKSEFYIDLEGDGELDMVGLYRAVPAGGGGGGGGACGYHSRL